MTQNTIMTADDIRACLERMARQLAQRLGPTEQVCVVGIRSGGVQVARHLHRELERHLGRPLESGSLDITLYRDDLYTGLEKPRVGPTELPFDIDGSQLILVDDVLFTGRTVRAALQELMDLGRPARILLAVLLDRGHRELPIQADVTGRVIPTEKHERVDVWLDADPDGWHQRGGTADAAGARVVLVSGVHPSAGGA